MYTQVYNTANETVYIDSYTAGTGISIISNVIANTGVLSNIAGSNISVSGATGNVTISVTGTVASATTSTNIAGGAAGSIPYQTGAATTSMLNLGTSGYVLSAGASAPAWVSQASLSVGTAAVSNSVNVASVSTNATFYPTFGSSQTGIDFLETNSSLNFNPSTGKLSATILSGTLTGSTSGTTLLAGDGSGGLANVTVGSGLLLSGGILSNAEAGGSVTTISVVTNAGISGTVANPSTTPAITLSVATQPFYDVSTNAATTQFVNTGIARALQHIPLSGITGGTYNGNSQGSGCICTVVASAGAVTSVSLVPVAGSGYIIGDILQLIQTGSNFDCFLLVTGVTSGGITSMSVLYGGTGYVSAGGITTGDGFKTQFASSFSLAGTLTSNATFILPPGTYVANARHHIAGNNTTGAFTVKVYLSNGSGGTIGSGVLIPQGSNNSQAQSIYTDGVTDFWNAAPPAIDVGTVTSLSVVSANGFAGTVATATTTPAITLTTSVIGVLKGNGTAISAAVVGTDYSVGTSLLGTGILKSTTSSGALSIAVAADFPTLNQSTTGNAATVTTNANLTGVITSVGNATSIASQTGTGTTFVMSNSPTLSTPNIGVATGNSLSVSGQLTSTVSTGTAPLVVSSTTQVANLNSATAGVANNIVSGTAGSLPYQTAANTTAMLPIGALNQVLTVSPSGLPAWEAATEAGTLTTNPVIVSTTNQTTFTVVSGYSAGFILVYLNGGLLLTSDYTAVNGTTVVLNVGANVGDEFVTVVFSNQTLVNSSSITRTTFTATDMQTTFSIVYGVNMLLVSLGGIVLPVSDYTATNGTSVVFNTPLEAGQTGEFIVFTAMNITNALNKTGDTATGVINAPTPATSTNNTQLATTAYVNNAIAANTYGRNIIVNGDCSISQVNGATLITPANGSWPIDMNGVTLSQPSKIQAQQVNTALNSLGATAAITWSVLSSYVPISTDLFSNFQSVEGYNLARLQYGTANAKASSLQFKVRASVAGTYSGAIINAPGTRSYPFQYTVSANTDTYVPLPNIPGDTGGTWVGATNAGAVSIVFDLGSGSSSKSTAGTWQSGAFRGVTGSTNLVSQVNGSTLTITDVQWELGSVCTQFERKLYDQNLRECQRYLPYFPAGVNTLAQCTATTGGFVAFPFEVAARASPTGVTLGAAAGTYSLLNNTGTPVVCTSVTYSSASQYSGILLGVTAGSLAAGNASLFSGSSGYVAFTGCQI